MMTERAKPIALGLVLACMVRSFFNSDTYRRGFTISPMCLHAIQFNEEFACEGREGESREKCRATLARVLMPTELACMSSFPDAVVFRNPDIGQYVKDDCVKEDELLSKCMQTALKHYGFSSDEIATVLGKRQPDAKPKSPSVEVAKEGSKKAAGQGGEKSAEKDDAAEGKEDGAGGSKPSRESEAPGRGEKPNVEVEERPKNGEGNSR